MHKDYIYRFYFVVLVLIIVCFVVWVGPLSQTIHQRRALHQMESEVEKLHSAPQRIIEVQNQIKKLESSVGVCDSVFLSQQDLFLKLSEITYNNHAIIREIPEQHIFSTNNILVDTNIFRIEGGFIDLIKLIRELENQLNSIQVVSFDFTRIVDRKTKEYRLFVELRVQRIRRA